MLDISPLMEPLERVVRKRLISAFLGIEAANITQEFCELLACAVRIGEMGLRNQKVNLHMQGER